MNIGDLKRRSYAHAKRLSLVNAVIQVVLLAVALLSAFPDSLLPPYVGVLAFLGPVLSFAVKDRSRYHYDIGEKARRIQILDDGLGRKAPDADLLDLADTVTGLPTLDPVPLESEFTSALPRGPRRLAHVTQEASYYSKSLSTFGARTYFTLTVVGAVATFAALWFLVQYSPGQGTTLSVTGRTWARAAATLLVFFVAGNFAEKWRSFESLAKSATVAFEKCDGLRRGEPSETDALLAFAAYDAALGRAPPIPTAIYRLRRARLHTAWTKLMKPSV